MKILVIHATAGAGHKKAAEAVFYGLSAKGGHDARLVDALNYTNPFFKQTYPWFYGFLVTRLPVVWGLFFDVLDIQWLQPLVRLVRRLYNGLNAKALEKFLIDEKFDVVITTQFLSAEVSAHLKRTGKISSRIICVVTDFDVHHIWVNQGIDIYTAACSYTRDKLTTLGVRPEAIREIGIPTDPRFSQKQDAAALRTKLKLKEGLFTVLIATGSFGMGPIEALMELLKDYQLLVVCGHNKGLYHRLAPKASANTHVFGLVDNMDELMSVANVMVTKPGGLSIAEALVKELPLVFFSAIPGQETNNIKVLSSYGVVAETQSSLPRIKETIDQWQANAHSLKAVKDRMSQLAKSNAVADIVALL